MLRTGLKIPSPLTPCYYQLDASFISRLANPDDIDRPIYELSAHIAFMNLNFSITLAKSYQESVKSAA